MRSKILSNKIETAIKEGWLIKITNDENFLYRKPNNRKDIIRIGEKLGVDFASQHSVTNVF